MTVSLTPVGASPPRDSVKFDIAMADWRSIAYFDRCTAAKAARKAAKTARGNMDYPAFPL